MPAVSRRALLVAAIALAAVGSGVAVAVSADEGIPRGVEVAGIEVGGLSRAQAESTIEAGLRAQASEPLMLAADGDTLTIDPAASGLSVDVPATVARTLSAGPLDRLGGVLGVDRDVDLVVVAPPTALSAQLRRVAEGFDRPAVEGSITFTPEAVPAAVEAVTGRELDIAGSVQAIGERWLRTGSTRLEVPVDVTPVRTSAQEVQRALELVARPAVAAPITVDVEGDPLVVEPADIAQALRLEPDVFGALVPRLLEDVLYEQLRYRLRTVGDPVRDATFDVSSGTPVVVPAKDGRSVSAPDLAAAVLGVLGEPPPRTASAPLSVATVRITTEKAATLGVREQIGTFTTRHPCCRPRVENIHRIAEIVDGHVVLPGETFDLNAIVGPRDEARGFLPAPQILEGQFVDAVGGGISQFATTLFNAVFFSGLEDVEHVPHSYYISRYPPGREATVS
ncbi:MAG: VanW family protein, partial [Actinobacteria bacterium]|nr:VanW family protein [Actinomycetota bacterium]